MGEIVNLKRERKRVARNASDAVAEANRMRFGRPAAQRLLDEARAALERRRIDDHKRSK